MTLMTRRTAIMTIGAALLPAKSEQPYKLFVHGAPLGIRVHAIGYHIERPVDLCKAVNDACRRNGMFDILTTDASLYDYLSRHPVGALIVMHMGRNRRRVVVPSYPGTLEVTEDTASDLIAGCSQGQRRRPVWL